MLQWKILQEIIDYERGLFIWSRRPCRSFVFKKGGERMKTKNTKRDIAIYGAGGFGREVLCLINAINQKEPIYNFIGFFDDGLPVGTVVSEYKVIGGINELNYYNTPLSIAIAIGNPQKIESIVEKIRNEKIEFPNLIAPNVVIFDQSKIKFGKGNIVTFNCILSLDVKIGDFNILNCGVIVGHDISIGNYNVINPAVRISGAVDMGNSNFLGVNSIILQEKKIGNNTTVGANSVIMRHTKDNCLYVGNPAVLMNL